MRPVGPGIDYTAAVPIELTDVKEGSTANSVVVSVKAQTCRNSSCSSTIVYTTNIPLSSFGMTTGKICFDATKQYQAFLYTLGTNRSPVMYSGDFMNWYFAVRPEGTAWIRAATPDYTTTPEDHFYKPSAVTRWKAADTVWRDLVATQLTNVNVGVAAFNYDSSAVTSYGAKIILAPTNVSNSSAFNAISLPAPGGATPLASAMAQIGAYFVGNYGGNLTLHPGQYNQATVSASTVFNYLPAFNTGVSTASPITQWCQKNFLLVISDGEPAGDDYLSATLKNYINGDDSTYHYLDDIGKALYEIDLRPDIKDANNNPVVKNIYTYGIGFSLTSAGVGLKEAARLGGGLYSDATDGVALAAVAKRLAQDILSKLASGSGIAFNSTSLQTNSALYSASYESGIWTGNVKKISVNASTGAIGATLWDFSALQDVKTVSSRYLFTNTAVNTVTLFSTLSNLSTVQKNDLNTSVTGTADSNGQKRLDYIRGTKTYEDTGNSSATFVLRARTHITPDIVNSSPTYVGAPTADVYPDTAPFPTGASKYSTFATNQASRAGMVYVGDNGGIFHAIDASTGNEKFGFLPLNLFSSATNQGYHYYTQTNYSHKFYVNGASAVADAYIKNKGGSTDWNTVLVSGEGAGGKGYFALNVTNPNTFTSGNEANIFMWEFSSATDADLGYTYSKPVIGLMNNGKWAAIFGNGYNSTNGIAKLFIVYLEGPGGSYGSTWSKGTDYIVISTGSGSVGNPDGLSTPAAVDLDGNGTIDRIYAGSAQGSLWAFDVSSNSSNSWNLAYNAPLITLNEPITAQPILTKHPTVTTTGSNQPNLMVYFGSGQFIATGDISDTSARGLYGVWDNGSGNLTNSNLVTQTLSTSGNTRTITNNAVNYATPGVRGWKVGLSNGERTILRPGIAGNFIVFGTMLPVSTAVCSTSGQGSIIAVDQATGTANNMQVLDTNGDNIVNANDKSSTNFAVGLKFDAAYPNQFGFLSDGLYIPFSDGSIKRIQVNLNQSNISGRISVQELRPPGS